MSDAPILTAESILATAIRDALDGYVGTYNGRPKVYYQLAEQGSPLPYVIYQCQTDIGRMDWIGRTGATVQLTVKALATAAKAARDLLATVAPGMNSISISGYTVQARYLRTVAIPPTPSGVYQSAHVYRIRIEAT